MRVELERYYYILLNMGYMLMVQICLRLCVVLQKKRQKLKDSTLIYFQLI